ncbi:MAG: nucleotide disphospho-sugar-binding domain-containing protein [Draconibacterium sp.]
MAKILYDILPAKGHFHATLKMATLFINANHKVVYALSYDFKSEIEKHGFEYSQQIPMPTPTKTDSINNEGIKKNESPRKWLNEIKTLIHKIKPDIVLLDEQVAFKALYYVVLEIPVILFQTKPDTRRIKGIPPFFQYYIPRENFINNFYCILLWERRKLKARIDFIFRLKILKDKDPLGICNSIVSAYGYNISQFIDLERSFGIGIKGLPRIVLSPKAFDFPHEEKTLVHRIGPLVNINREGEINQPRYGALIGKIKAFKYNNKGKVIYCSMGTITRQDIKRCTAFFQRIVKVAQLNSFDLIILSTGKHFEINKLLPLPENVVVFEHLPQIDLLQKCDIMITHGGMNSITECVFCEIPMLVYPLSMHWDQPGNSARVVFHSLGLRGRIEKDSIRKISKKLNYLKKNYDFFQNNVVKMKKQFERENNSNQVVEIIDIYSIKN